VRKYGKFRKNTVRKGTIYLGSSDYIAFNGSMINELERLWKELVMA
jgi:hypothetical protein